MKPIALALVVALAAPSPADADCASDADRLRAHLDQADTSTYRWNLAWTIAFGVAAAGQFALVAAEWSPLGAYDDDDKETLLVGGTKASIGLASRFVFPLRVHVPAANADRCVELAALRDTATALAKKERQSFWLTHIGGTSLNLAGMFFLWYRRSFKVGLTSFAISWPVGITSAYTLPRKTWKLWRNEGASWTVGVVPSRDPDSGVKSTMFVLGGEF